MAALILPTDWIKNWEKSGKNEFLQLCRDLAGKADDEVFLKAQLSQGQIPLWIVSVSASVNFSVITATVYIRNGINICEMEEHAH
ncbi:THO complex subunit 2 isoform X1 [Tachysurus ichikawai]